MKLSDLSLIPQRRTSLSVGTPSVTLQSRQGTKSSFWRIYRNHCRAYLNLLSRTIMFKAFAVWTLGAEGSLPLSISGSFEHLCSKSNGKARHLNLPFLSRLINCRICPVHKLVQSHANNLNMSDLHFLLLRRLGGRL